MQTMQSLRSLRSLQSLRVFGTKTTAAGRTQQAYIRRVYARTTAYSKLKRTATANVCNQPAPGAGRSARHDAPHCLAASP